MIAYRSASQLTVAVLIVNLNSGLYIVAKNIKGNTFTVILHRQRLDLDAAADQLIAFKARRYAVHHMIARTADIRGHLILIRKHAFRIQIARACDEVFYLGVLPRQLPADQMTAVVQEAFTLSAITMGTHSERFFGGALLFYYIPV